MKDPYSLIASIRIPFTRVVVANLWHRDRNGTDGACGWVYPRLTEQQRRAMRDLGFWEGRERHFLRYSFKSYSADVADREALYRAAVILVARMLDLPMTFQQAGKIAAEKCGIGGMEGLDTIFCWLPGYHSNYPEDRREDRADRWTRICCGIARELLRQRRPWYRHPRWHVHHWRFSFPVIARLVKAARA